ncbi:MAG TPA: ATP-binding protein, partial [Polyangiaceae bacterium]|nr:ATP-binding protein [Polyangiaceae bacterium]
MTLNAFREARLRDSREFELVCSEGGLILEVDERGERLLGECVGQPLRAFAVPETETKLDAVLAFPAATPENGWEVSLLARGKPVTAALRATRHADQVFVLGSLLPQEHASILMHMNETIGELADRQRETERQKRELMRLNRELSESNRGLLSLHAELDEKSDMLRRAADVKGRVVANVSHEFRTPLNSILGLSALLLERVDGDLTPEQEKQLRFIRHSASSLSELVNDLLDLSKLEAGKLMIRPRRFEIQELFAALRGMMRPLLSNSNVELVVESGASLPAMETDEGKISQILRNLVSNSVKFTEQGTIKVGARAASDQMVEFFVEDTGIGIAPENIERVFDEFSQIDSALQRQVKGTGLGLALSRKLAEVLGGTLTAESALGKGSVFRLRVPVRHEEVEVLAELTQQSQKLDPRRAPILVVEDDRQTLFLYEKYLKNSGFQVVPARSIDDARLVLERVKPAAIVLDVMLEGEATWGFLSELKESAETHEIP